MRALVTLSTLIFIALSVGLAAAQSGDAPPAAAAPSEPGGAEPAAADAAPALPPLSESLTGMARAEYEAARILYDDGDYQGALTKLTAAYDLAKDPRLLWNMAAAEKNLRHYSHVLALLERYLTAGEPHVTADDRSRAEELRTTVRGFVSEITFRIQPDGAAVLVDGEPRGTAPLPSPLPIDFGRRVFRVTHPGYETWEEALELRGGSARNLEVSLRKEVNAGTLKIVTDARATIRVDGRVVGVGLWEGSLVAGTHTVQLEAEGKVPSSTEVVVGKGETRTLDQPLRDVPVAERKRLPTWAWVTGGVVAAAAIGTGAYLAGAGGEDTPPIREGSWRTLEW